MTVRYTDSLRGYGFEVHKRDGWVCQYCGLDGKESFQMWNRLSVEHLLPKGHPKRNAKEYITTSCMFCNGAANRYFQTEERAGRGFDGQTPQQLIDRRRERVMATRESYEAFWREHVWSGRKLPSPSTQDTQPLLPKVRGRGAG